MRLMMNQNKDSAADQYQDDQHHARGAGLTAIPVHCICQGSQELLAAAVYLMGGRSNIQR